MSSKAARSPGEVAQADRLEGAGLPEIVRDSTFRRRLVLRVAVFAVMFASAVISYMLLREWDGKRIQRQLLTMCDSIERHWAETNLRLLQPLRAVCDDIDSGMVKTPEQFAALAASIRKSSDAYEAMIWLRGDGSTVAMSSADGAMGTDVLPYGTEALWPKLRSRARSGKAVLGPNYEGGFGRPLVLLYYPLSEHDGAGGGLAVVLRVSRLMDDFVDDDLRQLLSISVLRDGLRPGQMETIFRTGDYLAERDPTLRQTANLRILDQIWKCQVMPTSKFMKQYQSSTPTLVLAVGAVGCVISAGSLLDAMKRRWQHMILERGHLQVIDIISGLARSVSSHRGEWPRSLLVMLESAQPIVDSDVIGIYQFTPDRRRLELVSTYGLVQMAKTVELTDEAQQLLHDAVEGRPQIVSRDRRETLAAMRLFGENMLHSGVIAPLQVDRVIGVMVFASLSGDAWSDGRCALVRLWASQTASLLADEAVRGQMRDALTVQEKLAERREMMLTLLGEIYQAGSIEGTLTHIAQHAPKSLGIEACVVALRTKRENELEIVAATGDLGVRFCGRRVVIPGERMAHFSRPDSVAVIVPRDMEKNGLAKLAEPWLAGLAYIPMNHSDGRAIGCLILMSANQGAFTDDQLELARVLANRASAAIENAYLTAQIKRDAETRAMLLRELNHRVKNNMAGIVGLLSMSSNMEMPANVRSWLDRVIERIGNMARAHELFSGGITTVSLSQLVEQVIPSLAVVKPPGVVIKKELGEKEIRLKTTQAVSLAMIIHEVSYNAIVHGLGARGTLTIRATQPNSKTLVLEIIDDGTAGQVFLEEDGSVATMAPPATSTGLGLRLVKGLVGRELRGRFDMRRRDEGGTVVSVEFPLERERD